MRYICIPFPLILGVKVVYIYAIFHENLTYLKHVIKLDFSCTLHGKKAWIMYEIL